MEFAQPIERARQQEIRDLAAAIIVDQRVPVGMEALPRVGVLVKRGTVKPAEPVRVGREMPGNPIQQQSQSCAVAGIDKGAEIVRRSITAGRRKQRDRLVSPGAVERILGDRHQLQMREPHFGCVGDELVRELAIGQIPPVLGQVAAPRAEMDFVDRDRRLAIVALPALRHPAPILPQMSRRLGNNRRRVGRSLGPLRLRVRLERQELTVGAEDLVFVEMTGAQARDEQLPEPADISHRHPPAVPSVEVANDADPVRVRRPYRKGDALDTLMDQRMRSELAVARQVVALGEQMNVDLAKHWRKRIDVVEFVFGAAARHAQPIAERLLAVGNCCEKETVAVNLDGLGRNFASRGFDHPHILCTRQHRSDGYSVRRLVHSEK